MSLANIKRKDQGFTIVELLIVVVVIAVLAAITIVSYNGITGRANKAAAQAAVATFQKKAELFAADGTTGKYPVAGTDLSGATTDKSFFLQASAFDYITTTTTLTANNGTSKVNVRKCAASGTSQAAITSANITGLRIYSWDYDTGAMQSDANATNIGVTTVCPAAA